MKNIATNEGQVIPLPEGDHIEYGEFQEDGLTEDFPFEIKAIFFVMVAIVLAGLIGSFL